MGALQTVRIVVVDDPTAKDAFLSEVLMLAAPAGSQVQVFSLEQALAADKTCFEDALVLVKSPMVALALRRGGLDFQILNMGGLGARAGRSPLWKNISATSEEVQALVDFEKEGGQVVFQIVPTDPAVPLSKVKH